ncbi:uncharacterized protein B0I36DRAFT_313332 [Microdochium trichocladiopsis]|uniref:Secreted protein n=1 Tax=Microdochium trichocladiopsis TaxID=1682393 RepID=A0A9P8YFR4_9PEZI|nr:uncharacterized protein B0I36DRAFT_313332 [Microdochium trichocladiopsis]KAH7037103.1 hypothetical protein B0I36DRAFT_313332 [Microdochium trichocladiopsis]
MHASPIDLPFVVSLSIVLLVLEARAASGLVCQELAMLPWRASIERCLPPCPFRSKRTREEWLGSDMAIVYVEYHHASSRVNLKWECSGMRRTPYTVSLARSVMPRPGFYGVSVVERDATDEQGQGTNSCRRSDRAARTSNSCSRLEPWQNEC